MGIMLGNLSVKDIETRLGITFSAEDSAFLQETRQKNARISIETGKWHCFDIPFIFMTANEQDARMFREIFNKYSSQIHRRFEIAW